MIGIPVNPNSVYIPVVQTGCLKAEFDSTYPIHLNGIINENEFQESIHKINHTIASRKILLIVGIIFILSIITGIILFIVGAVTATSSFQRRGFPALIGVGVAITILGIIFFAISCCTLQFRRADRMRQAIAEESRKYSSRSPIPCSWRLDSTTSYGGYYGNQHRHQIVYHLVIDIGRSIAPGSVAYYPNQIAPDQSISFGGQSNYAPPPYPGQSTGFCSQCNAPRQALTSQFCSSCGHSFNKY
ncbi:unnamed protein product [Adineta steineri]|uniref:Uncharacterized protein n=1 Tax=Adineta steineri TaxID=433720 RepID=A0A816AFS2_9BILA|nr:unnamed protein product [Adineta steineri]CAF1597094.1 unnamed protein product [Adineta steineri]